MTNLYFKMLSVKGDLNLPIPLPTYGKDLVKTYIESKGATESDPAKRWELFGWLLSNEVTPLYLSTDSK